MRSGRVGSWILVWLLGCGLAFAPSAESLAKTFHQEGKVTGVQPLNSVVADALSDHGVKVGAKVVVDWEVDLSVAPFNQTADTANYTQVVTGFRIQIGTWEAVLVPGGSQNGTAVNDDFAGLDQWHVTAFGDDTDLILRADPLSFLLLSLDFVDATGRASSDLTNDQNPARYPLRFGSVIGQNGVITFDLTSSAPGGSAQDPTSTCRASQLSSAAALCAAELRCLSKDAKRPNPGALGTCMGRAGSRFLTSYERAASVAQRKGKSCGTTAPAVDVFLDLDARIGELYAQAQAFTPQVPALLSSAYAAAAKACSAALKAESREAKRSNLAKLALARSRASAALAKALSRAHATAEKRGTPLDDPDALLDWMQALEQAVDDTVDQLNGD